MLRQAKGIAVAEFKSFFTYKSNIFWVIAWPILLMILASYLWLPQDREAMTLRVGLCWEDEEGGRLLKGIMENVTYRGKRLFSVKVYNGSEAMLKDLEGARLDGGLCVPRGFFENLTSIDRARLLAYVSGEDPMDIQINRGIMQSFLFMLEEEVAKRRAERIKREAPPIAREILGPLLEGVADPVEVSLEERTPPIFGRRSTVMGWYLIGVLTMMFLYSGLSFGAAAVIAEKESGRLDRILAARVPVAALFLGKMTAFLAILLLSSALLVATGLYLGARLEWSPTKLEHLLVPLNVLLIFIMTVHLGFVLSLVAESTGAAASLGTIVGLLASFTTGVLFPKDMLPGFMRVLADLSPITWAADIIRGAMVYNASLEELAAKQLLVIVAAAAIVAAGLAAYRKTLSRYVEL